MDETEQRWRIAEAIAWWMLRRDSMEPGLRFEPPEPKPAALPGFAEHSRQPGHPATRGTARMWAFWAARETMRLRLPGLQPPALRNHSSRLEAADIEAVVTTRVALLLAHGVYPTTPATNLAGGRLAVYYPDETIDDGHSQVISGGFFDGGDAPPADIWLWYVPAVQRPHTYHVVSWVPSEWLEKAAIGMRGSATDAIHWAQDDDVPRQLLAGG